MSGQLVHLDLFSGVGGFSLACEWAGIETIGFVENDKYCQKVLRKHWPAIPIVEDIRDVEKIKEVVANATGRRCEQREVRREAEDDAGEGGQAEPVAAYQPCHRLEERRVAQSRQGHQPNGICQVSPRARAATAQPSAILITAGFPCQPFSVAGKRGSKDDDRYLWPETLAVIEAVRPKWVLLENVAGIIPLALDDVLSDLEGAGYAWETVIVPACAVNAWHRRDRVWVLAFRTGNGRSGQELREFRENYGEAKAGDEDAPEAGRHRALGEVQDVADTADGIAQRSSPQCHVGGLEAEICRSSWDPDYWAVEPELGRVAHGVPNRVDRLKCLGNAIVPQVAFAIIQTIKEVETA